MILSLQKWSKGKVRDKLNNQVLFDKPTYDKLLKEVPSYKLITPSVVSERLKVRGSLARRALDELLQKGVCYKTRFLMFKNILFNNTSFNFFSRYKSKLTKT